MTITLLGERAMSWNKFYAGQHWMVRKVEADRIHELLWYHTHNMKPFGKPVEITVIGYFDKRPLDPDNIMEKFYIDGLRRTVLVNDTPTWITKVSTMSRMDKLRPRVEIIIEEVDQTTSN